MRKRLFIYCALLFIVGVFFFSVCYVVPFHADDLRYQYDLLSGKYISGLVDAIHSTFTIYKLNNARLVCNFLGMVYTNLWGKGVFNVVNTILFLLLICTIYRICINKNNHSLYVFIVVIIGSFLLNQQGVFYWGVGNSNYLVPALFSLGYILLIEYRSVIRYKGRITLALSAILAFVFSLQHEMFCVAILGGVFCHFVIIRKNRKSIDSSLIVLYLSFLLGSLIVIFCPSQIARANSDTSSVLHFANMARKLVSFFIYAKFFDVLVLLLAYIYIKKKKAIINKLLVENSLFFLLLLFSLVPAVISKIDTPRPLFAVELFSLILIIRILPKFFPNSVALKKIVVAVAFLFIVLQISVAKSTYCGWKGYKDAVKTYFDTDNSFVLYKAESVDFITQMYMKDIDNQLHCDFTTGLIQQEKEKLLNKTCMPFCAIPHQVYCEITDKSKGLFVDNNKIGNSDFFSKDDMGYAVMKYDKQSYDDIMKARLYALYKLPLMKYKIKIHYSISDIENRGICILVDDQKYGKYILLNKTHKRLPLARLIDYGFEDESTAIRVLY